MAYDPLLGCVIEDIAYIEACRAGPEKLRRKNKKWRKMLDFPQITTCFQLSEEPKLKDYNYVTTCQPIGAKLFHQFCISTNTELRYCALFLEEVKLYQLRTEDERFQDARSIVSRYITQKNLQENETLFRYLQFFAF